MMTIEEKAKAYDEAIKRAKEFEKGEVHFALKPGESIVHWIFPELKESWDEKTRKALVKIVKSIGLKVFETEGVGKNDILLYLERQKEPEVFPHVAFIPHPISPDKYDTGQGRSEKPNNHLEQPVCEGLEEEIEKFIETFGWGKTKHLAEKELISATARHFAKWQAEKDLAKISRAYENGATFGMKLEKTKIGQQIRDWSDKEKEAIQIAVNAMEFIVNMNGHTLENFTLDFIDAIDILSNLRAPSKLGRDTWDDYDSVCLNGIKDAIKAYNTLTENHKLELFRWLDRHGYANPVSEQNHWKPSEEQMEALKFAIDRWENGQGVACPSSFRYENISQLYNALKKLIKEG